MKKLVMSFLIGALCLSGCQSIDGQKRLFVDMHDSEIGRPFYDHEKPGMKEVKISDSLSEFVPETIPSDRAVVVWTVDTTQRGPYRHPTNGTIFMIQGI